MADPKKNPLIGAFRTPVPGTPPSHPAPPADQPPETPKVPVDTPTKPADGKKEPEAPKVPADAPAKSVDGKKVPERPKAPVDTPAKSVDRKKVPEPSKVPADTTPKSADGKKEPEAPKPPLDTPAKPANEKKKGQEAPKAPVDPLTKPANEKKGQETPKAPADTPAKPTSEKKGQEKPKAPADTAAKPADGKKSPVSDPSKPKDKKEQEASKVTADTPANPKEQESRSPDLRFVALSKIKPLPGTYVKDEPRKDYSGLIADIKKNGLQKPIILRQSEKEGEFQLVDGFHRCKALEQAGMLEVRADVYEMTLAQANEYRRGHRDKPLMPVPGKLVPYPPEEPAKADKAPEPPAGKELEDEELPKDLKIPLTKKGQPETVTTMKAANIRPFEGHPFAVRDNKDMWDLVDSIKKFGVLEPVMVIPHKDGGYEMVSGHRRMRACQLAGIEDIPVIVRNLDRDEAIISMVDSNLKREEISPMEKARAYQMKTDAMKRKMGRRTKEEIAQDEAMGIKRMNADEELAQQVGESPATIQRYKTLNKLVPELQDMVDEGKIPVNTGADIAQMKPAEQKVLADAIQKEAKVPSGTKAKELKAESKAGKLTTEKIEQAVAPTKREEMPPLKVTMLEEDLRPFFPDKRTTIPDVKQGILEGLKLRQIALERQKAKAATAKKADTPTR